jgi:hypothetical protein
MATTHTSERSSGGRELCDHPNPHKLTETRTSHQPLTRFPSDHTARRATRRRMTHHTGIPTGSPPNQRLSNRNERAAEVTSSIGAGGWGQREIPTRMRLLRPLLPESNALPLQESRRIGSSSWKFLTETLSVVDSESQSARSGLEKSGLGLGEMACVGAGVYIGGDRRALGEKLRACFCHGCETRALTRPEE